MSPSDSTLSAIGIKVETIRLEQELLIQTVFAQGRLLSQIHAALHPEEPPKGETATALLKELIEAVKSMHDDIRRLPGFDPASHKAGHGA
ncbi:hypothetical protein [Asaia sp. As-1742]|uniref:hypothetical protein n=1 Tax=Asaia sp. As-1742 TaxID=2608325 RepID=UPI00141E666F|nr:hypothetical protein [Asaia sp. As-1742]NIE81430.1 hypothetical protein [Asaia sp. As-1742]